jgi:hypothetical protein
MPNPPLPPRLYKYHRHSEYPLAGLRAKELWFAAPATFNDPFDCALHVVKRDLGDADLERALAIVRKHPEYEGGEEAFLTNGKPNDAFRDFLLRTATELFEAERLRYFHRTGVCCFGSTYDNLLMWSHYADGHRGFCLAFSTVSHPFSTARHVEYCTEIPLINPVDLMESPPKYDLVAAMVRTKADCWSYEAEWRLLHHKPKTSYAYATDHLKAVYFGAAMPDEQRLNIQDILRGQSVDFYAMKIERHAFRVTAEAYHTLGEVL